MEKISNENLVNYSGGSILVHCAALFISVISIFRIVLRRR